MKSEKKQDKKEKKAKLKERFKNILVILVIILIFWLLIVLDYAEPMQKVSFDEEVWECEMYKDQTEVFTYVKHPNNKDFILIDSKINITQEQYDASSVTTENNLLEVNFICVKQIKVRYKN